MQALLEAFGIPNKLVGMLSQGGDMVSAFSLPPSGFPLKAFLSLCTFPLDSIKGVFCRRTTNKEFLQVSSGFLQKFPAFSLFLSWPQNGL